jgi:hypothetical protein
MNNYSDPIPGTGCGPTWGTPAENILIGALQGRGFTIIGYNPADRLSDHGSKVAKNAHVRFGGMDVEVYRQLGPNNRQQGAADPLPIWTAFDAKGHRLYRDNWSYFGVPESSVLGAVAFANWRHCHTVFALVPYDAPGIWITTLPQVLSCPRDQWGKYIVNALDCPSLDQWIASYHAYEGGRLGGAPPPPPLGGTIMQFPQAS